MKVIINKSLKLKGKVLIPSSKSHSIRAMFFALLAQGESTLLNVLDSEDTKNALQICKSLGAQINLHENKLLIKSKGAPFAHCANDIFTGNSGISTHFMLPLLGFRAQPFKPVTVHCGEQMKARPIHSLLNALKQLGMTI